MFSGRLHQCILFTLILLTMAISLSAEVPQFINYQGRLTDSEGNPVADGPYLIKFKIYGSETGTDSLWSSGFQAVTVTNGLFSYKLGTSVPLPPGIFGPGSDPFLGLTIGTDAEVTPRTAFTSSAFAWHANSSETSQFAATVADGCVGNAKLAADAVTQDKIDDNAIHSAHIQNGSILLQDLNQNGAMANQIIKWNGSAWTVSDDAAGTGDITGVTAGSGLTGGGASGSVTLAVATDGITSTHIGAGAVGNSELAGNAVNSDKIENGTITDSDISTSANISTSKIYGTAANLTSTQTFSAKKTFSGEFQIGDSTMRADGNGIVIGNTNYYTSTYIPLIIARTVNTINYPYGISIRMTNNNASSTAGGITIETRGNEGGVGVSADVYSDSYRMGINCRAHARTSAGLTAGESYGAYCTSTNGIASYGGYFSGASGVNNFGIYATCNASSPANYGVYGTCEVSNGWWGGYFYGNLHSTGTNTMGASAYIIDHPDDPENMYLTHSDVASPDMKNIYDGVAGLDANGEATIELPPYFESLNENYRYQLTAIGSSMPDLHVSQKIVDNRFVISGGTPFMEVSWMVTGIRKDAFAKAANMQVEKMKAANEKGRYMHPEIFGFGVEKAVDYENHKDRSENLEPEPKMQK